MTRISSVTITPRIVVRFITMLQCHSSADEGCSWHRGRFSIASSKSTVVTTSAPIDINRRYPGLRQVHRNPDIYTIDNFFNRKTCEGFITVGPIGEKDGSARKVQSKVFGGGLSTGTVFKSALSLVPNAKQFVSALGQTRKSTTWFLKYGSAGPLIKNALTLVPSLQIENCEEPQVVRYDEGDFFDWHEDALPANQARKSGTMCTCLTLVDTARSHIHRCTPKCVRACLLTPVTGMASPQAMEDSAWLQSWCISMMLLLVPAAQQSSRTSD